MTAHRHTSLPNGPLPWTRACFVCGEENPRGFHLKSRLENGRVITNYTTRMTDVGYRHIVHGGICMTLLDEVMTWAAIIATGKVCVAAEMTTRLKHPVSADTARQIEGWVTKDARRILLTEGQIIGPDGEVVISASGKYVPVTDGQATLCADDFVIHPDTIPPGLILRR